MQKLSFDYSLNQYEISGRRLDKESLAYLQSVLKILRRYAVVFPDLHLKDTKITAMLAGRTHTLGDIYTQGIGEQRVIYPCFRHQWGFDFTRDIQSLLLWKDMSEALRATYSELESGLLSARGDAARARVHLALLKDFIAMAKVEGNNAIQKQHELNFLRGLISLHYLGIAQKQEREFLGVNLPVTPSRSSGRVKRAVGASLNLLIGEDVAAPLLYWALMSYQEQYPLIFIEHYFSYKSKGVLQSPEDLIKFAISFRQTVRQTHGDAWRISALTFPTIVDMLEPNTAIPADPEAAHRYIANLDKEFVRFRKDNLDRLIGSDQELGVYSISSYHRARSHDIDTLLGGGRPKPIDVLSIDYISPGGAGAPFDGIINIVGHADIWGLAGVSSAERIAGWIYSNFTAAFGERSARFKEIKYLNFSACNFPKAMAEYVAVLFVERCLEAGRFNVVGGDGITRRWIPNITVICSPHSSLMAAGKAVLVPFRVLESKDRMPPLPGVVLNIMKDMPADEFRHFISKSATLDFADPVVQRFLQETHVFSVTGLVKPAFESGVVSEAEFDQAKQEKTSDYAVYEHDLEEERKRRRAEILSMSEMTSSLFGPSTEAQHVARMEHLAYERVSIRPGGTGAFLPVNTFETMRLLHGYYAEIKNRYRSRRPDGTIDIDAQINSRQFKQALEDLRKENRIKFLIDPADHRYHYKRQLILKGFREHLGIVDREFQDFPFYSSHDTQVYGVQPDNYASTSYYNQQLAQILFFTTKQEYREITGIEVDRIHLFLESGVPDSIFRTAQQPVTDWYGRRILLGAPLYRSLLGSEQLGVSTRDLRALLESGDEARILPAIDQLENSLQRKKALLRDSASLRSLQETQENLGRAKTAIEKKQLSPAVLKSTARVAAGSSRLLGAFGVFVDFRTQPFHLDFSSVRSGLLTTSDSLAVVKGVFDFTSDIGPALALRLASSASRALWQPRLDHLFFKMNKVLLPLDVLFTAVSLYRNVEGARLAKSAEEQALYITMTVIDGVSFGVNLAGFILIGVPGVGVALILVGMALAVVNILLNAIVSLAQLDNYRWDEKVGLFFSNLFGASALQGILTQQQMRQAADRLFDGYRDPGQGQVTTGVQEDGVDLFLTPMINDSDDRDQTNPLKGIGALSQGSQPMGYTLSPRGLSPDDLQSWADAKGRGTAEQVHKGWYLRRREARRGRERKLMVTMPATPNTRLEVLDFGPVPTILLFGATPHLLLEANPFGWAVGESPQEQALNKYQVRLHAETPYTLQFKKSEMTSKDFDSNFGSRTELVVPPGALPQVSLDLSGQDAREALRELDLSGSSLEVTKFKGKSTFRLDLVNADGHGACALEQVVRTVQLPADIRFKSGENYPVMAVVGDRSQITLRNSTGCSLLLLRSEVSRCDIELQASVSGFAVSI
ncbi:hypothetical protein HX870_00960 [Pseudomonas gingeri]|uniref:hypothetical protein n=1 Tax=Pseudomonas gingeri TaxID=117681 RepID=UPI00159FDD50|nr:hypothetical protein [Pseudomonas gingeri]NWD66188.1 hypothetical protein [Pseudomonas gingeri]